MHGGFSIAMLVYRSVSCPANVGRAEVRFTRLSGDLIKPLSSTPQDLAPQLCAMLVPRLSQDHLMPGRIERNLLGKVHHSSFIIYHHSSSSAPSASLDYMFFSCRDSPQKSTHDTALEVTFHLC